MSFRVPIRRPMIARLVLLAGIALTTMGAQWSCNSDGTGRIIDRDPDTGEGSTFSTSLVLRDSTGAEADQFVRAELIQFELTVRNRTDREVRLSHGHPPDFDFVIFDDGTSRLRWQFTENRGFPAVIRDIVFAPAETRVFTFTWDQVLADGAMLPRGRYEARGAIPFPGFESNPLAPHELGSRLRRFRIN